MGHVAKDPDFEDRVRKSFERQKVMTTFDARIDVIEPGHIQLSMPFQDTLTQQHGTGNSVPDVRGA